MIPTGDVSMGEFSFTLSGVSVAKPGVYDFMGLTYIYWVVLRCIYKESQVDRF